MLKIITNISLGKKRSTIYVSTRQGEYNYDLEDYMHYLIIILRKIRVHFWPGNGLQYTRGNMTQLPGLRGKKFSSLPSCPNSIERGLTCFFCKEVLWTIWSLLPLLSSAIIV